MRVRPGNETSLRTRLLQAALDAYGESGIGSKKFAEICDAAGVARGSGYRIFPSGTKTLLCTIHRETVASVIDEIRLHTSQLRDQDVFFADAVTVGLRAAVKGLRETPYCIRVLSRQRDFATAYLLNRQPHGIFDVLTTYVARCAATFGSDEPELRSKASQFVWSVLNELVRRPAPADSSGGSWPELDEAEFELLVAGPVAQFVNDVGLADRRREGILVPEVGHSDPSGMGFPIEVDELTK